MVSSMLSLLFALGAPFVCQGSVASAADVPSAQALQWYEGSYNRALSEARKEQREVVLVFAPEWSNYSAKLRAETLVDPAAVAALQSSVCLDVDPDSSRGAQIVRLHNVDTFPTIAVLTSKGAAEDRIVGFIPAQALVGEMARIRSGTETVSALRDRQTAAPDDLSLRNDLANKLAWVGDLRGAQKLLKSIRRDDPTGATLAGARLIMQDTIDQVAADGGGPALLVQWDLSPLQTSIERLENVVGRAEGWNRLATLERQAGRPDKAIAAWRRAWSEVPAGNIANWTRETVNTIFGVRDGLDEDSRAFAMEIAQAALASENEAVERDELAGVVLDETEQVAANARRAMLLDTLAFAHIINGEREQALTLAAEALALDPENEELQQRAAFFLADT